MNIFEQICREWLKGCSCATPDQPEHCLSCTAGLLNAIRFHADRQKENKEQDLLLEFVEVVEECKQKDGRHVTLYGVNLETISRIIKEKLLKKKEEQP